MYKELRASTFSELANALIKDQQVAAQIYSDSPSWGDAVAKRVQSFFIAEAKRTGGSPMSASYDGYQEVQGSEGYNLFKFTLADIQNKSLIHHAQLTRFKEEEL